MTGRVYNNVIEVRQGDSFEINVAVNNKCQPVDLTGATILMQVKQKDSGDLMFEVSGTAVDVEHGKMMLYISPTDSAIPVGDYVTDIQVTTADGHVNTVFPANVNQVATFRVTPQVTEG